MHIQLNDEDSPYECDRSAAVRIIEEMLTHDIFSRGTFALEGYSVARRILKAMTAARADERRRGFEAPYRMRTLKPAPGAPAVMAKRPRIRPLHRRLAFDGLNFQYYRAQPYGALLISDDARIEIHGRDDVWWAVVDGEEVANAGMRVRVHTEIEALRAATGWRQWKDNPRGEPPAFE